MTRRYTPRTQRRFTRFSEPSKIKRCRVRRCEGLGYNRYCWKHTPEEGTGVLKCHNCKEPLAEHKNVRLCKPVSKANQGGTT